MATQTANASSQAMREALIVVSNRLPFVLKPNEEGQLVRKFR